eukprot:3257666-Pyramimonas_sp.AAC.1
MEAAPKPTVTSPGRSLAIHVRTRRQVKRDLARSRGRDPRADAAQTSRQTSLGRSLAIPVQSRR